jgi:hypothetical protein
MPDDRDISLLRARGYEEAAQLLEAKRAGEAEAQPTSVADVGIAAGAAGPMPPPGKGPLTTLDEVEALSDEEFSARYDEVAAVMKAGQ